MPIRRLPPLNALRSFEAAGRLKSLGKAAEELCVTHSAVAQQIRLLEDHLGQKLFERQGRHLVMTVRARHYLADVQSCLQRLSEATRQLAGPPATRVLQVNASVSFAHGWLIPRLAAFHALHPDIEVMLSTTADLSLDQLDPSQDVTIRRYEPNLRSQGFISRPLLPNRAVAICAPQYPALPGIRQPADVRRARLLHFAGLPEMWQYWLHCAAVEAGETLAGPIFDQFFLLIQAAANGLGIGLAPYAVVRDDIAAGRLLILFPEVLLEGPPFHCLYRELPQDRELSTFVDWLLAQGDEAFKAGV